MIRIRVETGDCRVSLRAVGLTRRQREHAQSAAMALVIAARPTTPPETAPRATPGFGFSPEASIDSSHQPAEPLYASPSYAEPLEGR